MANNQLELSSVLLEMFLWPRAEVCAELVCPTRWRFGEFVNRGVVHAHVTHFKRTCATTWWGSCAEIIGPDAQIITSNHYVNELFYEEQKFQCGRSFNSLHLSKQQTRQQCLFAILCSFAVVLWQFVVILPSGFIWSISLWSVCLLKWFLVSVYGHFSFPRDIFTFPQQISAHFNSLCCPSDHFLSVEFCTTLDSGFFCLFFVCFFAAFEVSFIILGHFVYICGYFTFLSYIPLGHFVLGDILNFFVLIANVVILDDWSNLTSHCGHASFCGHFWLSCMQIPSDHSPGPEPIGQFTTNFKMFTTTVWPPKYYFRQFFFNVNLASLFIARYIEVS